MAFSVGAGAASAEVFIEAGAEFAVEDTVAASAVSGAAASATAAGSGAAGSSFAAQVAKSAAGFTISYAPCVLFSRSRSS